MARSVLITLAFFGGTAASNAEGPSAVLALGRHLAEECSSCHRDGNAGTAIPGLAGRPAREISGLLEDYRADRRSNPAMVSVAQSLKDVDIAALAAYFESLPGK